jgi:hypothetical protein
MSQSRKTLTQHATEIEQWIAQGWLMGHETFIELQDMAIMTDLIYQEAHGLRMSKRRFSASKGAFRRSWHR